ncbi:UDP-N-acetylmuramoyl-L-alanine--D-glutamate ligase [Rheinheimera baltica]|uniref:UDP-N-acetylmuramoylalanine--D-glutamate ligase n=1 Tax=Rheinheimera baltica TaxID=67576 RepID=A0ABT9HY46_9GAMM|nr:UDP-N-acetylmuramoyl-L-alanine--D-glutamate ligase [Rheinheimera baltica]MDP5136047.1 UDP-N-acetylmuramoyl-L-alanine--D-glutamate ligase [Rheinheimera baltica]MDP5190457.1 UDP-N-acetylmuramoyl-L-alanine--D-glutamate ligase [Rheinheimera baltica]
MKTALMHNLAKKRIAVVGLGLSGLATVRFLLSMGVKPILMDSRTKPAGLEHISAEKVDGIYLGELDANRLAKMDMIVLSPGLSPTHPAIRFAVAQGAELLGDVELFARVNDKPVIAITGSNGKSTVTKLVEAMLKSSGVKALAAGNIGLPILDAVAQHDTDVFVLELSSFQLDTTYSLHSVASCILNVSADHLDRYHTMAAYTASKQRVYQHTHLAVFNLDDVATTPEQAEHTLGITPADNTFGIADLNGERWIVIDKEPLLPVSEMTLFGAHNEFNALVSCSLALAAGASRAGIVQALKQFESLPHRCVLVAEKNNVRWVNDSKATNIGATLAAIAGLRASVAGKLILIAGGDGKGADMAELLPVLTRDVQTLITLGKDGPAIASLHQNSVQVKTLHDAVKQAAKIAQAGDMVLLSPACASLDMFTSYSDRGEQFVAAVKAEVL